jgi:hypothetical protein
MDPGRARRVKAGAAIDLRNELPPSVTVIFAENQSQRNFDYQLAAGDRRPIDTFARTQNSLLVLTRYNDTARSFRGFFNRRIPLWEGHTRPGLEKLITAISAAEGDRAALAAAVVAFMDCIGKGFSPSKFGNRFEKEVREGCTGTCRGVPATIQELAWFLIAEPTHCGVAKMLRRLSELAQADAGFSDVAIDCSREFWEAVRVGDFDTPDNGFAEMTHRRVYSRPQPPDKAISIIHKAKGLECDSVIIMPCDAKNFPDKPDARCLLYVALSRAKSRLLIVASRKNPSPLFHI